MSDYMHQKVLRYPIKASYFGLEDICDVEINEKYRHLFLNQNNINKPHFQPAPTEESFIDYLLYEDYGECSDDFGRVRELSEKEKDKYRPIFQQLIPDVDMNKVHLVEFCWYNCSEAPDYYEISTDSFNEEI